MSKNINVEAHTKRYEQTDLGDIINLIDSLQKLIERKREEHIAKMKETIALLESGAIPPPEPKAERTPRTTRGGKKKETTA